MEKRLFLRMEQTAVARAFTGCSACKVNLCKTCFEDHWDHDQRGVKKRKTRITPWNYKTKHRSKRSPLPPIDFITSSSSTESLIDHGQKPHQTTQFIPPNNRSIGPQKESSTVKDQPLLTAREEWLASSSIPRDETKFLVTKGWRTDFSTFSTWFYANSVYRV